MNIYFEILPVGNEIPALKLLPLKTVAPLS